MGSTFLLFWWSGGFDSFSPTLQKALKFKLYSHMVGLWILVVTIYWWIQDVIVSTDWWIFSQFQRLVIFEITVNTKTRVAPFQLRGIPDLCFMFILKMRPENLKGKVLCMMILHEIQQKYKGSINISNKTCTIMVISIIRLLLNAGCFVILTLLELQKNAWKCNQYSKKTHYCNINSDIHKLS